VKAKLLEVGLQRGGRLLKHADGQLRRVSQALIVGVITHLAMRPPDGIGQALPRDTQRDTSKRAEKRKYVPLTSCQDEGKRE
jgi:hypothetical protein